MNWRDHNGGACPTHPDAIIRLRYRGVNEPFESKNEYPARQMRWSRRDEPGDIIAYLVTAAPAEEEAA